MLIDVLFVAISYLAAHIGFQQGLIRASVNLFGWVFALGVAVKLTPWLARVLNVAIGLDILITPLIAFFVLGFGFWKLIGVIGGAMEGLLKKAHVSVFNGLMGSALYASLFLLLFSLVLKYADRYGYVPEHEKATSRTYYQVLSRYPDAAEQGGRIMLPFAMDSWYYFMSTVVRIDSTLQKNVPVAAPTNTPITPPPPIAAPTTPNTTPNAAASTPNEAASSSPFIKALRPSEYDQPTARPRKYKSPQ